MHLMKTNIYVGFFRTHKPTLAKNNARFDAASISLAVSAESPGVAFAKLKALISKMHEAVEILQSGAEVFLHEVICLDGLPEAGSVLRYESQNPEGFLICSSLNYPDPNPLRSFELQAPECDAPFAVLADIR
jgi:hypothetical protein